MTNTYDSEIGGFNPPLQEPPNNHQWLVAMCSLALLLGAAIGTVFSKSVVTLL